MDASGVWDQRHADIDDLIRAGVCPPATRRDSPSAGRSISTPSPGRASSWWAAGRRYATVRDGEALFSGGLRNVFSLADLRMNRLLATFDEWARRHGRGAEVDPPERFEATSLPASPRLRLDLAGGEIQARRFRTSYRR
ncbi:hypothetical protein GCM10023322_32190 [Rugosimonospora acidiphila]|uniref:Uncharacterized protein n=1 Tax=Rugosimonospora acidiphila TaxID=556531 RepID=A0ABP9RTN9_9ACTN